jgi:uncharacterized protein
MEWLNEPASWQRNGDVLRVSVDPGTDFWRATGYGYVHDNGHVYGGRLPGDLDVSVRVRGAFASQYDQAGIMLRADEETWLKTGLEFFEGRPRLSTVLTMGWSSWMVADLPPGTDEVTLRVSRRGEAVEVRYAAGDGAAELAALVFMPPDREMLAGIVCAAPEGTGFSVAFHDLRVVGREWGGREATDGGDWAGESAARADGWSAAAGTGTGAGWAGAAAWEDERTGDRAAGWAGDGEREAGPGWTGDRDREAGPGWAGDRDREAGPGWAGDGDREAGPGWAGDRPAARATGWAGDVSDDGAGGWAGDKPRDTGPAWAGDKTGAAETRWVGDQTGQAVPGWALGEPDKGAARPRGKPGELAGSWGADRPEAEPGRAGERPGGKTPAGKSAGKPAGKSAGGVPDGWDDELPGDESLDWAKPQASEPAADWDRLSLSLSTTSWNAFAAAKPAPEQPGEPAPEQLKEPPAEQPDEPAAGPAAGRPGQDREDSAAEQPEPAADQAEPVPAPAGRPEAAKPDEVARGKNGRGRNKAKLPVPQALPPPADPADEWISLLTADSAEELSTGELPGPTADETDPG